MKWLGVIVLTIIGIVAAVFAVEYLTVLIGHLPSWIPGHDSTRIHGHLKYGHYRKRGALAALVAIIAFGAAGFLVYRIVKPENRGNEGGAPTAGSGGTATPSSTEQLLATPPPPAATGDAGESAGS
jgi:hypothetical protein